MAYIRGTAGLDRQRVRRLRRRVGATVARPEFLGWSSAEMESFLSQRAKMSVLRLPSSVFRP